MVTENVLLFVLVFTVMVGFFVVGALIDWWNH